MKFQKSTITFSMKKKVLFGDPNESNEDVGSFRNLQSSWQFFEKMKVHGSFLEF